MRNPTIDEARTLCERIGAKGVIILAFTKARFVSVSYGTTTAHCRSMGKLNDKIAEMIEAGDLAAWECLEVVCENCRQPEQHDCKGESNA